MIKYKIGHFTWEECKRILYHSRFELDVRMHALFCLQEIIYVLLRSVYQFVFECLFVSMKDGSAYSLKVLEVFFNFKMEYHKYDYHIVTY